MGYGKQCALCHNPMASNNVDMFCFLTLPIPVPQPKWMGLANRVKALVQGAQRLLKRSNVAVPASEVTLSVFFLPPAFPSALAVSSSWPNCQGLYKTDVAEPRHLSPNSKGQCFPHPPLLSHAMLPTQTSLTPKFSKLYSDYSLPSPSFLWLPQRGVILLISDTREGVTSELNLLRSDCLQEKKKCHCNLFSVSNLKMHGLLVTSLSLFSYHTCKLWGLN